MAYNPYEQEKLSDPFDFEAGEEKETSRPQGAELRWKEENQEEAEKVLAYRDQALDWSLTNALGTNLLGTDVDNEANYEEVDYHIRDSQRLRDLFRQEAFTMTGGVESAMWLENAPKDIQNSYNKLKDSWDKVEHGWSPELGKAIYENTKYVLGDPVNYVTLGIGSLATKGLKKAIGGKYVDNVMAKALLGLAARIPDKATSYAKWAGAGFGWGAAQDMAYQAPDIATDLKDQLDWDQTKEAGAYGAIGGLALRGAGDVIQAGYKKIKGEPEVPPPTDEPLMLGYDKNRIGFDDRRIEYAINQGVTRSEIKGNNARAAEEDLGVQLRRETGILDDVDSMSSEQLNEIPDAQYTTEIDSLIDSIRFPQYTGEDAGLAAKASIAARRDLDRAKDSSREKILADKEERMFGGAIPAGEARNILEETEYNKFIEDMMEYENSRDFPDVNSEHDYYLIKDVGELFYNENKQRQQREWHTQSMVHWMENREKYLPSNKTKEQIAEENGRIRKVIDASRKDDIAETPPETIKQAEEFVEKIMPSSGAGEVTRVPLRGEGNKLPVRVVEEVADAITAGQTGHVSPDGVRAKLYKIAQRFHGKYAFGRPTKFLTKFRGDSPLAMTLAKLVRYDSDETFISPPSEGGPDYNETFNKFAGKYSARLMQSLDEIKYVGGDTKDVLFNRTRDKVKRSLGLATGEQEEIVKGLRANNFANLDEKAKRTAEGIRSILDDIKVELQNSGVAIGELDDYVPRLWNKSSISSDFYGQSRVPWSAEGRKQLAGSGENRFAKLLVEDGEAANIDEANDIVAGMLLKENSQSSGIGNSFLNARKFDKIKDDNKYSAFLDNNIENTMFAYITQAANSYTKKAVFDVDNLAEFEEKWVDKIAAEVRASQGARSEGELKAAFSDQDRTDIIDLYKSVTGEGLHDWENGFFRTARDAYTTGTRTATLPLATLSSLPEVFLNIRQVGTKETLASLNEAMAAWATKSGNDRKRIAGELGLTDPEIFHEMRQFNMIVDNAAVSAADRLSDTSISSRPFRIANNIFFKSILLEQWTQFGQMASFIAGKNLIHKNLKEISDFGAAPPTQRIKNMREQLAALGVKVDEGVAYLNRNKGEINTKDPFYNDIKSGAARYTRTVIMDNNPRSALKPMFMSDPKTAWLTELMGYPAAFTNKVLKDMARGLVQYAKNPEHAARIVGTTLIMTAAGAGGNELRNMMQGKSTRYETPLDKAYAGFVRNGFIPVLGESALRAWETQEYTGRPLMAFSSLFGPIAGDIARVASYGQVWPVIGPRFVPGYYAYSKETRGSIDDFFESIGQEQKGIGAYRTGGIVKDVLNAPEEPDERIDRITGLPYDIQAGAAHIDAEDRLERRPYSAGSAVGTKVVKPLVELTGSFVGDMVSSIKTALKRNDRKVDEGSIINVAKDIQNHYGMKEGEFGDVPSILEDPEFKEALVLTTQSLIDEKEGLSKYDPLFGGGGKDFSKARGYTDEQIEIHSKANELADRNRIDYGDMMDDINYVAYKLDTIGARDQTISWDRKLGDYIDELNENAENMNAFFKSPETGILEADLGSAPSKINKNAILSELEQNPEDMQLAEKIFKRMPRSLSYSKIVDEYTVPKQDRERKMKKYLENSKEKDYWYRGAGTGMNFDYNMAFAFPFEVSTHVGTKPQANVMMMGHLKKDVKNPKSNEPHLFTRTEKEVESFVSDPELGSSFIERSKRDPEVAVQREGRVMPINLMRGYIQVERPLVLESPDFSQGGYAQWFHLNKALVASILKGINKSEFADRSKVKALKTFMHETQRKMRSPRDSEMLGGSTDLKIWKDVDDLDNVVWDDSDLGDRWLEGLDDEVFESDLRANRITGEVYDNDSGKIVGDLRFNEYDKFIKSLLTAEINLEFKNALQEMGFDSIKYFNPTDTPRDIPDKDAYSYVLFEPGQFKLDSARDFDVTNPRPSYAGGGKILSHLKRKRYSAGRAVGKGISELGKSVVRLFHGAKKDFEEFNPEFSQETAFGKGFSFTPEKEVAKKYANITPAEIKKLWGKEYVDDALARKQDGEPVLYEVEASLDDSEVLLARSNFENQNEGVKEKIKNLITTENINADNIDLDKPKFWKQIIQEVGENSDTLFARYGIKASLKDATDSDIKQVGGNLEYTVYDSSILNLVDKVFLKPNLNDADALQIGVDPTLAGGVKLKNYTAKDLKAMDKALKGASSGGKKDSDKKINAKVKTGTQVAIRLNLNSKVPNAPENMTPKLQTLHSKNVDGDVLSFRSHATVENVDFVVNQTRRRDIAAGAKNLDVPEAKSKHPAMAVSGSLVKKGKTVFDSDEAGELVEIGTNPVGQHLFIDLQTGQAVKSAKIATVIGDRVYARGVEYWKKSEAPKPLDASDGTSLLSSVRYARKLGGRV